MSWLSDLFRNPQLGYSPNLEPPGWNLLRDMMMRKIFNQQSNPYGYDPSSGQSMSSLLPTGGRGTFNPYSGGYGSSPSSPPNPGGTAPRTRVVGRDARMPVVPSSRPSPVGGGDAPSSPARPTTPAGSDQPGGGGVRPLSGSGGQSAPRTGGGGFTFERTPPTTFNGWDDFRQGLGDLMGREPMNRPPDANPNVNAPPIYQGPPRSGTGPGGRYGPQPGDSGEHYGPHFDGREIGCDASPYMFQMGPRMLGSDAPTFSNDAGMAPGGGMGPQPMSLQRRLMMQYFGGDPAALLQRLGFSWANGPGGTTFNRGGGSYLNAGGSHEGAGPGGESAFLAGQGFAPSSSMRNLGPGQQYGGQLGLVDRLMAHIAQMNRRGMRDPNGAMGSVLPHVNRAPGFVSGMAAPRPAAPRVATAPTPNEGPQTNTNPGNPTLAAPGGNPNTSTANRTPTTGNVKINVGQKPPVYGADGLGYDAVGDPTQPLSPGGAPPTATDQGGDLMAAIAKLIGGGGGASSGGSMPLLDMIARRNRRPLGFDALPAYRMSGSAPDFGMRNGVSPSPY